MRVPRSRPLFLLGLVALASWASGLQATAPADITGAWRINGTDDAGKPRLAVLYLAEENGKLTGRWNTRGGSVELHEVTYEAGKLSFWWYVDIQTTMIRLVFSAEVHGDEMQGELREPNMVGRVTGTRVRVVSTSPSEEPEAAAETATPAGSAEPPR